MSVTGHSPQIAVDAAAAYELVISLGVWSDAAGAATYEVGPAWFDAIRGRASAELLGDVERFCGGSDLVWAHLLSLAYECPPPRDIATFLAYLPQVDPMEVRLPPPGSSVRSFRR